MPTCCNCALLLLQVALDAVMRMLYHPRRKCGTLIKMDYYPEGPDHAYLYGVVKYFFSLTLLGLTSHFACVEWLNTLKGDGYDPRVDSDGNVFFELSHALYNGMALQVVDLKDVSPTGVALAPDDRERGKWKYAYPIDCHVTKGHPTNLDSVELG